MSWQTSLGAFAEGDDIRFRVWAPKAERVELVVLRRDEHVAAFPLEASEGGYFSSSVGDVVAGDRYLYRIDGQEPLPDPASRFQPGGPHCPSEVIDPTRFSWTDAGWSGVPLEKLVLYELHVGTFSPQGTYDGVIDRLEWLADLGVTAIELMPLAEFAGSRNWGYDGVGVFAPSHHYGRPDDLRRLVDRAHAFGLGVFLDVVYNHLGPDGNYLPRFSPYYFTKRHRTVWGASLNFDGRHCGPVREFFIQNALHWMHEYHVDGLRLDATHAIVDDGPRHFLAELSSRVKRSTPERQVLLIAEDHRNSRRLFLPEGEGGWGVDGVWADDFHHQVRRRVAGDHESFFGDFTGSVTDLAETIRRGWFFCGQHSTHWDEQRGSDPTGVPLRRFVHCIQNHDQVGNRAFGERLHHQVEPAVYRAATVLLLMSPATPLLFMGQEWGAGSPFLFFTDHEPELGKRVTRGRRREFRDFSAFSDPQRRDEIPDPQAEQTFLDSRLNWDELEEPEHASVLRLYRRLLALRRNEPAFAATALATTEGATTEGVTREGATAEGATAEGATAEGVATTGSESGRSSFVVTALDRCTLGISWTANDDSVVLILVRLAVHGATDGEPPGERVETRELIASATGLDWMILLTTEAEAFAGDPCPPDIDLSGAAPAVTFLRSGAVILKGVCR